MKIPCSIDYVVCMNSQGTWLKEGDVYKVRNLEDEKYLVRVYVNDNTTLILRKNRFRLLTKIEKVLFI